MHQEGTLDAPGGVELAWPLTVPVTEDWCLCLLVIAPVTSATAVDTVLGSDRGSRAVTALFGAECPLISDSGVH